MVPVIFDKAQAETFIDALHQGKPFSPPDGKWNYYSMTTLAAVLLREAIIPRAGSTAEQHDCRVDDLFAAVRFLGSLVGELRGDEYNHGPVLKAEISRDTTGETIINATEGF